MRKNIIHIFLLMFICVPLSKAQDLNIFFKNADLFFATNIQHNSVPYNLLDKKKTAIDALVHQIAIADLGQATALEQKAFYINAYNLLVIKNVLDFFPIASPNEVLNFWDEIEFTVASQKYTLEALRTAIFTQFQDNRLNFVLTDGTISGAPIIPLAYTPEKLEEVLNNRCIEIFNNSKYIQYNKTEEKVTVSGIFKLYAQDFEPNIITFVNPFRVQKIDSIAKVVYDNYDARLNNLYEADANTIINAKKNKVFFSLLAPTTTLPKGSLELNWYSGLFTVTYGDQAAGMRSSFLSSLLTANYGVTGRLDVGMTFMLRSDRINDLYDSSPFKVFEFERTNSALSAQARSNVRSDWGFSHVGAQVRFAPFKNIGLAFEQGILFPIKGLPENNTVDDKVYFLSQIFLSHSVNSKTHLFFAFTSWQGIKAGEQFKFTPPMLRVFLTYYFTHRFSAIVTTMYFLEWGAGLKFLITPKLEIQAIYTYYLPIPGVMDLLSSGASSIMTYSAGLRYRF